jgi:hypothetical protein
VFLRLDGSPIELPFLQAAFRRITGRAGPGVAHPRVPHFSLDPPHGRDLVASAGVPLGRITAVLAIVTADWFSGTRTSPTDMAAPPGAPASVEREAREANQESNSHEAAL